MAKSLAPTRLKLLTAVTTAANTGTSLAIAIDGRDEVTIYFTSTGTTSGGTLKIEEADYDPEGPTYAGTWSQIGATVNASDFTGGAQQAVHISPNSFSRVRVRVATDITGGGSVTVTMVMQ